MISNDMNTDIYAHKFIILASYSTNSLGQIRSLGWKGIKPIVVFFHRESGWIEKSKYISEFFVFEDSSQGLDYVIKTYGNEPEKPFLYTDCDEVVGEVGKFPVQSVLVYIAQSSHESIVLTVACGTCLIFLSTYLNA